MAKVEDLRSCSVCGKPLTLQFCGACKGSGKVRAGMLGKKACQVCGGKGTVYRCPDSVAHLLAKSPKIGSFTATPTPGGIPKPVRTTCPVCRGTKGIRLPFTGQAGPCPRCGGRGWV